MAETLESVEVAFNVEMRGTICELCMEGASTSSISLSNAILPPNPKMLNP